MEKDGGGDTMNIAFDLRSWKNGKTMEGDSV
jgi:hypothetical protein